jgi:hypothetical protein
MPASAPMQSPTGTRGARACLALWLLLAGLGGGPVLPAWSAPSGSGATPLSAGVPGSPTRPNVAATAPASSQAPLPRIVRHADPESLEADLRHVPLDETLRLLQAATGWEILTEPGINPPINVAFRRLPLHEALPRLLGELHYAVVQTGGGKRRLLIYRNAAAEATQRVETDDRIANHLVVRLNPDSTLTAEALAALLGGEAKGSIDALNAHLIEFKDGAAADAARSALAGMDDIASVEGNFQMLPPEMAEAVQALQASQLHLKPAQLNGNGLLVGLIDTAVQSIGSGYDAFLVKSTSIAGPPAESTSLMHGTSMFANLVKAAEITLGPGSEAAFGVISVDVYGGREMSTSFDVARGIAVAVGEGATVINASLGSNQSSPILHDVVRTYQSQGVLFIAAAGNQPVTTPTFPSGFPEVIAVSSGLADGSFAPFANRSPAVDLLLPGSSIVPFDGGMFRVSGTSVSAARASGIATGFWLQQGGVGAPADLAPRLIQNFGVPQAP